MTRLSKTMHTYATRNIARVLTQMDRDPDSPTYGCFDRYYWHYKMRDFPSSILQQGLFTLEALRTGVLTYPDFSAKQAHTWTVASINALSRQVDSRGRVSEYYPFEASYPAAAFGLYATMRVLTIWHAEDPKLLNDINWAGLRRLAHHLNQRIEPQAANQFSAGLAGLALATKLPAMAMNEQAITKLADTFFKLQHEEGWFPEYGGPDFGYLTVTIDALADYHEATNDPRALTAADNAITFLASLIGVDGQLPWTLNSRNTDYITPYGLAKFGQTNALAATLLNALFSHATEPQHFLAAVDDRYHCHYVLASLVRSLPHIASLTKAITLPKLGQTWLSGCGYLINHTHRHSLFVGAYKGGLVRIHRPHQAPTVDHGWRVQNGRKTFTNNWWHAGWEITLEEKSLTINGALMPAKFPSSTPIKHIGLRACAWLLRQHLMPILKRVLIFQSTCGNAPHFQRILTWHATTLSVTDTIAPCAGATATPAPRQNRRHVASADSFHKEENLPPLLEASTTQLESAFTRQTNVNFHS